MKLIGKINRQLIIIVNASINLFTSFSKNPDTSRGVFILSSNNAFL